MLRDSIDEEKEQLLYDEPGCWQRMFYNTKCQIILVLFLCAFITIRTSFLWKLIWNVSPNSCHIESDLRFDLMVKFQKM